MIRTTTLKVQLYRILNPHVGHVILQTSPRKSKTQSMTPNQWPSSYKSGHKNQLNANKRLETWSLLYKAEIFLNQGTLSFSHLYTYIAYIATQIQQFNLSIRDSPTGLPPVHSFIISFFAGPFVHQSRLRPSRLRRVRAHWFLALSESKLIILGNKV